MMATAERDAATMRVIEELKRLYKLKILPLEQTHRFDLFVSPHMSDAEFDSKPQVMLIGQYSVGKTTFIRYLLGRDFPGQRIGPEPTTDKFVAVFDGPDERTIPGNALAVSHDMPYRGLEKFGVSFLNRFEGAQVPCALLRNITLVDTPGILSGEKQRVNRGYDFTQVCGWFATRADLILLLFDAHKLDISDELKAAIESLKGNDEKIRCILNKADQIDRQKLMRVYGALMWSLGKVVKTPEVLRVYVGSFWDQPLMHTDNAELFKMEEADLMKDLKDLPRNSAVRKINELVKRVRLAKVHAYIIGHIKEQMPTLFGHAKKQKEIIENLGQVFRTVMRKYDLAPGDFPDIADFQSKLQEMDFSKFHKVKEKMIQDVEQVLGSDFPRLMEALPRLDYPTAESSQTSMLSRQSSAPSLPPPPPTRLASATTKSAKADDSNPWWDDDDEPVGGSTWALQDYIPLYQNLFNEHQSGGLVNGAAARGILSSSGLSKSNLKKIWDLGDINKDGALDLYEFVIVMHLVDHVKQGGEVPDSLDDSMIPPK